MLYWNEVRDQYVARFGRLVASHLTGTGHGAFFVLQFQSHDRSTHAFASLGASGERCLCEVAIVARRPMRDLVAVAALAARRARALSPGVLIPCALLDTPFSAFLCLPMQEEASFAVG